MFKRSFWWAVWSLWGVCCSSCIVCSTNHTWLTVFLCICTETFCKPMSNEHSASPLLTHGKTRVSTLQNEGKMFRKTRFSMRSQPNTVGVGCTCRTPNTFLFSRGKRLQGMQIRSRRSLQGKRNGDRMLLCSQLCRSICFCVATKQQGL